MESRKATIVVDLGFGDAGKGTMIDFLARKEDNVAAVVRFNGGGQAAHNVVTPDGRHHTFSQFGSASFVTGVRSHISRFSLLDPVTLCYEAGVLADVAGGDPLAGLSIDQSALVVTPFHKAANRLREALRGIEGHGTCGQGIGEAMGDSLTHGDAIRAEDLCNPDQLGRKLKQIQERKYEELREIFSEFRSHPELKREIEWLTSANEREEFRLGTLSFCEHLNVVDEAYVATLASSGKLLFEGAQGVLLDEWYGFHPHTTWSTTTFENAISILSDIGFDGEVERLGVVRAYHTRHGAGPFPTYDPQLSRQIPDFHNGSEGWQGEFRVGWFDLVLARYAIEVCGGIDSLAVTNLDRLEQVATRQVCDRYRTQDGRYLSTLPIKEAREDLRHQERLTQLLGSVATEYKQAPLQEEQYLQILEDRLSCRVKYTSSGPSACDKQLRDLGVTHTAS